MKIWKKIQQMDNFLRDSKPNSIKNDQTTKFVDHLDLVYWIGKMLKCSYEAMQYNLFTNNTRETTTLYGRHNSKLE